MSNEQQAKQKNTAHIRFFLYSRGKFFADSNFVQEYDSRFKCDRCELYLKHGI